jgi:hypothetical protein
MQPKLFILPLSVAATVIALVTWAAQSPQMPTALPVAAGRTPTTEGADETVAKLNHLFASNWEAEGIRPAQAADELQMLRRLSLSLHGTIPSLEEVRQFEADNDPDKLKRWTDRMLADTRFGDYFAERLARSFVGVEGGAFIIYRRDRFVDWLAGELNANRPYDELVRQMISEEGLWTGKPATNFVTATINENEVDENKLAARCVRAFLGQRIDCAQCHDHPFDHWTQAQFEGLAAHFGQTKFSIVGVEDKSFAKKKPIEYEVDDYETEDDDTEDGLTPKKRVVAPAVPFGAEWLPKTGSRRERLAGWITHAENRRFERAIVCRVWAYLFGKSSSYLVGQPYEPDPPIDDLPEPGDLSQPDVLDILGADFREHGYDLKRLIHVITATRPFQIASTHSADIDGGDPQRVERLLDQGAVFPLTRLRPEQVIGAMIQTGSIKTIDQNSHLVVRFLRFVNENNFVKEYGDLGEDELQEHAGTLPQALLRMNGQFGGNILTANPFTASGRIVASAGSDEACLEACFLVGLTRRPTYDEKQHLLPLLKNTTGDERKHVVEDIYWSMFNSPEFSWNH